MKRIALLTVLLLVVGLTAFAIDVKPTVALSGSASVTFGFDLDNSSTGFSNSSDADLTVSLLAEDGSDTHAGTGDVYGEIKISNLELFWTDGAMTMGPADTDVAAKIVAGMLTVGVYAAPGLGFEKLDAIENGDVDDTVVDIEADATFGGEAFAGTNYGTYLTVAFAPVTLTANIVSNGDWTTNVNNEYAFGVDAVIDLKPATVTLGLTEDYVAAVTGFYAKLGIDLETLDAWVGFEGASAVAFTYAAGGGVTLTLAKDTTLAVSFLYGEAYNGADAKIVFTEPEAGLVPGLDDTLTVYLLDIADDTLELEYEIINTLGYKVALNDTQSVRPYATVTYGTDNNVPTASIFTAEVGVAMNLFPLTTMTAKYVSGNLVATPAVMGTIQFVTTVTY